MPPGLLPQQALGSRGVGDRFDTRFEDFFRVHNSLKDKKNFQVSGNPNHKRLQTTMLRRVFALVLVATSAQVVPASGEHAAVCFVP